MADPDRPAPMPTVPPGCGDRPVPMPPVGPGPGPRPVEPVFPHAEARAALQALDDLYDDLGVLASRSRELTGALLADGRFHGSARDRFEDQVGDARRDLVPGASGELWANRVWLVEAIAAAEARQDQYERDLAAWTARADEPQAPVPV